MFCSRCGTQLPDDSLFCSACGARLTAPQEPAQPRPEQQWAQQPVQPWAQPAQQPVQQPVQQWAQQPVQQQPAQQWAQPAQQSRGGNGIPAPGWSDRINDPEIRAKQKKVGRATSLWGLLIVPLPFVGFQIYASVTKEMKTEEATKVGMIVSLVFLAFFLYSRFKARPANDYEGTVVEKSVKKEWMKSHFDAYQGNGSRRDRERWERQKAQEYHQVGVLVIRTTDGKQKTIREQLDGKLPIQASVFDYLENGDRVRYHASLPGFPYERYDKAGKDYLYCPICQKKNDLISDRCSKCHAPLLK